MNDSSTRCLLRFFFFSFVTERTRIREIFFNRRLVIIAYFAQVLKLWTDVFFYAFNKRKKLCQRRLVTVRPSRRAPVGPPDERSDVVSWRERSVNGGYIFRPHRPEDWYGDSNNYDTVRHVFGLVSTGLAEKAEWNVLVRCFPTFLINRSLGYSNISQRLFLDTFSKIIII